MDTDTDRPTGPLAPLTPARRYFVPTDVLDTLNALVQADRLYDPEAFTLWPVAHCNRCGTATPLEIFGLVEGEESIGCGFCGRKAPAVIDTWIARREALALRERLAERL